MNTHRTESSLLLKRLGREYVYPHRKRVAMAVVCMIILAASNATNAWLMQPVLDDVFVNKNHDLLLIVPVAVAIVMLIGALANYGQTILMRTVGQRVISNMQIALFEHLIHADLGTFHDQASGRMISRFTNDINMMRHSISNVFTSLAKECFTAIFLVGVMFYQSWQLAIIALFLLPIGVLPILRLGRRMRKVADFTQAQLGEFTAQLDETFQGARVVKAYVREEFEISRARKSIEALYKNYIKAARIQTAAGPMMEIVTGLAIAGVIWYGGYQVIEGVTTPGAFFSFITAMLMAFRPVKAMAGMNSHLQEGLAAANRFFQAVDVQPHISNTVDAVPMQFADCHVRFNDVHFHYGEGTGGIEAVNLDIPAGKTIALVGPSGGGKSTIINLILRFYDVQQGSITIDSADIRNATLASLRSHIALVSQETVLFDDTVRANIAYGKLNATDEEVIEAAKQADAHEFISLMPQGYETPIGPHGVKLSGGQRQRISIARAILKNAPILLLDEATSALDSESERSVQKALQNLMHHRTTVVIAHRLSTIMHADMIYVLEKGRVVESGHHESLLQKKGKYYQLFTTQFLGNAAA